MNFSGGGYDNVILFDMGYRANKEYILSSLLKKPIDCLYIYNNESQSMERCAAGNFSMQTFYDYTPSAYAAAREYMFSEQAPSCIGYDLENHMEPVFEEGYCEHYFNQFVIKTMQRAALDFICDFEKSFSGTIIPKLYRRFDASLPFEYFMNYSSYCDRSIFACVEFEDDTYAGKTSRMLEDWEKALQYHKLNFSAEEQYQAWVQQENSVAQCPEVPDNLKNLYADGLFVKFYGFINKKFPIGSKKRERIKKLAGRIIK